MTSCEKPCDAPSCSPRPATAKKRQAVTWGLIVLIVVLYMLDQGTKWWVVSHFRPPIALPDGSVIVLDRISVISDAWGLLRFDLLRVHNTGVAFGMGNGTAWASYVFLAVPVLALIGLFWLFRRGFFETRILRVAWAFITAGILGNLTDRLVQGFFLPGSEGLSFWERIMNGYVVDFLDFSFPWITTQTWIEGYHWPAFNIADSCICVAAAIFFVAGIVTDVSKKKKNDPS